MGHPPQRRYSLHVLSPGPTRLGHHRSCLLMEKPERFPLLAPVFMLWTRRSLDKKTPLLRPTRAMIASPRLLKLIGTKDVPPVKFKLWPEQEYSWSTSAFVSLRARSPAGRPARCSASPSAKGASSSTINYFWRHPPTGAGVMQDVERQNVTPSHPAKLHATTKCPGQLSWLRFFEAANVATDQPAAPPYVAEKYARKHGMNLPMHEKAF